MLGHQQFRLVSVSFEGCVWKIDVTKFGAYYFDGFLGNISTKFFRLNFDLSWECSTILIIFRYYYERVLQLHALCLHVTCGLYYFLGFLGTDFNNNFFRLNLAFTVNEIWQSRYLGYQLYLMLFQHNHVFCRSENIVKTIILLYLFCVKLIKSPLLQLVNANPSSLTELWRAGFTYKKCDEIPSQRPT